MERSETTKPRLLLLLLIWIASLQACATVQSAPQVYPKIPDLPAREPVGPSYLERMQNFLLGRLPAPTDAGQGSKPAIK